MNFMFLLLIILVGFVFSCQAIIYSKRNIKKTWEKLYAQLIHRCELVSNLLDVIKKNIKKEEIQEKMFSNVIYAINGYARYQTFGDVMRVNSDFILTLKKLFAYTDKYPDLKKDIDFQRIISEISRAEDRIENMRQNYNSAVSKYNKIIVAFPNNYIASLFNMHKKRFFSDIECERTIPKNDTNYIS